MILRLVTAGLLASGIALAPTGAAVAGGADGEVSLVVGLRSDANPDQRGADVVDKLEESVDVVATEALDEAVAVDVPADQAAEAAAALRADPAVAYVERDHVARIATTVPNDPAFARQRGLTRTGVDTVWDTTRGRGAVVVAVIDTGVKAVPDLAGRVLGGYDFVNDDSDATDDQGHGTMTASVIASGGDNGVGVAGICWFCKILPVKVLDSRGSGSYTDIARGIRWAADKGADIINLSLGGADDSQLLRDAVAYASGKGAVVLAAAGNSGSSQPHYPAAIPAAIAVGAVTAGDLRYSWSNYGSSWVDIAAPGCNQAQAMNGVVNQFCGTSSATPFVAGVAALLASTNPTPTAATIRSALTTSADKIPGAWVAASSGRVDAVGALASLPVAEDKVAPATSFVTPSGGTLQRGTVLVSAWATDNLGIAKVELLANGVVVNVDRSAPYSLPWRTAVRGATVTLGLRAYDRGGNVATSTRRVVVDNWGPTVRITSGPASGTRRVRKTQSVIAQTADRSGIRSLELLVNGKVVQRSTATRHTFAVQTWKFGKTLKIRVRAYDRAGNVSYTGIRTWHR
ncbi:S8 family serine peptidase [Actinoplanes sp. NPDC051346]|uniref:S8 family serine peptidase n=1 Tax=Actinoplanes sp. NPDC051346 TaxID=3155048 RepID=UPI00342449B4